MKETKNNVELGNKYNELQELINSAWSDNNRNTSYPDLDFVYGDVVSEELCFPKTQICIVNKSQFQDENYPCYAKEGDSGFDLKADIREDVVLKPLERYLVPTGIFIDLPKYCEIQVRPKSGVSINKGLMVAYGTVDSDFIGMVQLICYNLSNEIITIKKGEKLAQCVVANVMNSNFVELVKIDKIEKQTERGDTGFGSSGK